MDVMDATLSFSSFSGSLICSRIRTSLKIGLRGGIDGLDATLSSSDPSESAMTLWNLSVN